MSDGHEPAKAVTAKRRGKVIITGTGRAGTTLLVRILTRLGLDTQFTEADLAAVEQEVGRAGLEKIINAKRAARLPEIVKSPHLTELLETALAQGWFTVDHAIVPVRALADAARSRARVTERARTLKKETQNVNGGLWDVTDPDAQEAELARKFHSLVETLVKHQIPTTFLSFPRFATDADYLADVLGDFLSMRFGVTREQILAAHAREARPALIGEAAP
ncbi:MAG: hypothetical protein ACLGIE_14960 [Alphaproteobacteria bacterium]